MNNFKLPKPHLSFTQIDTWIKSKDSYRKKYYGGQDFPPTAAMDFGNTVTKAMENGEEWVAFIPHHAVFERELKCEIEGIPIHAFVDNSDPSVNRFREQKTGKTPWTQNKVNKHLQLDIYSLLLEEIDGFVEDECDLIWVETEDVKKTILFNGIELEGMSTEIRLVGSHTPPGYKIFPRVITKEDRQRCRELIVRVGREIEEDFAAYKHLYQN